MTRYYGSHHWRYEYNGPPSAWPAGHPTSGTFELKISAENRRSDELQVRHMLRTKMGLNRLPKGTIVQPLDGPKGIEIPVKKLRLVATADATTWQVDITDYRWATIDGNGVISKEVTGSRDANDDEAIWQWIRAAMAEYIGVKSEAKIKSKFKPGTIGYVLDQETANDLPPADFSNAMNKIGRPVGFGYRETPEWRIFLAGRKSEANESRSRLDAAREEIDYLERALDFHESY
jgi:hypothetical protein